MCVPIVAERAMWWPGSDGVWMEGHVAVGHPSPAPIIVDHSLYWTIDGRPYDGGTSAPGTRVR